MKLFLVLLVVGAILAGCIGGAPQITVSPESYDFGDIPAAEPVSGHLTLRNAGDKPLQIESLSTSCGCTTAEVDKQTIPPGDAAYLTVTFDPQAHPGLYGPLMRIVYVKSNDPQTPELEITVTVNVLEPQEAGQ